MVNHVQHHVLFPDWCGGHRGRHFMGQLVVDSTGREYMFAF